MRGPDRESSSVEGIVLEATPNRRLVFNDAFSGDWMPQKPFIIGIFELTPHASGTLYRASARHWDEESMQRHVAMGFTDGWSAVAGQIAELAEAASSEGS